MKTAVSYFEDQSSKEVTTPEGETATVTDRRILCVYNRQHGAWMLPGSDARDGIREGQETEEEAQARILFSETGLRTVEAHKVYENSAGVIFAVAVAGTSRNTAFFSREEFLAASPFRPFFVKLFAHLDQGEQNNSRVVLKSKKNGKVLHCIITESWRTNDDGKLGWWLDQPEYIHADSVTDAQKIYASRGIDPRKQRLFSTAPAIGFKVEKEDGKGKILIA